MGFFKDFSKGFIVGFFDALANSKYRCKYCGRTAATKEELESYNCPERPIYTFGSKCKAE
jgi:hypothetical protein